MKVRHEISARNAAGTGEGAGPLGGHYGRTWLNDVELQEVTSVGISSDVDEAVRVRIELLATDRLVFEGEAEVTVNIMVPPGCEVVETEENGRKVYRAGMAK